MQNDSPLMKSASHFFLAMSCTSLAEEMEQNENIAEAQRMCGEAEVHYGLSSAVIKGQREPNLMRQLDKQLQQDYEIFARLGYSKINTQIIRKRCQESVVASSKGKSSKSK